MSATPIKLAPVPGSAKHRGAFFTPQLVSAYLARWAVRTGSDRILEPSAGEASFLVAAAERLNELQGGDLFSEPVLRGVEIHAPSIKTALDRVRSVGRDATIDHADFFDIKPEATFDAVLGNPPFVRYQTFAGDGRRKSIAAAAAAGVELSGLASSWAAFVVHSSRFLRPEGRLGFVVPAEMLTVKYAAPVRDFLLRRFKSVRLFLFEELIFPDALEDVVLLMAEGSGGCSHFEVSQVRNAEGLLGNKAKGLLIEPGKTSKWSHALVEPGAMIAFNEVLGSSIIEKLGVWGRPYLGCVTGENRYFTLTDAMRVGYNLRQSEVVRISPPGSRHLRGLEFSQAAWEQERNEGKRCWLFSPDPDELSSGSESYIAAGEQLGVQRGYKCRVRDPWFVPPTVAVPDLFLTYMDHERPRLTTNSASAYHLNSLYGVTLQKSRRVLGRDLLPLAALNCVTLLSAELVGRSYGGGMLKLEPTEAEQLAMPSALLVEQSAEQLRTIRPQVATALRSGNLAKAAVIVDSVLFRNTDSLSRKTVEVIRSAREFLFQRRSKRGRTIEFKE